MTDGFAHRLLVEFSAIFDEEPRDLQTYLTGIKRSDLLNATTFLLGFNNRKSKYEEVRELLKIFFCSENESFAKEVFLRLNALQEKHKAELIIITTYTCLQLFEFCFEHLAEQETQSNAELERNIFKSILLLNELSTKNDKIAFDTTKTLQDDIKFSALSLSQTLPYSDVVNYELSEVIVAQMIKSIFLFEFLEANPKTKILLEKFLNYFDCNTWKEYLLQVFPFINAVTSADREAQIDIVVEHNENFDRTCLFFEKMMLSDEEEIKDYDYRKIRSKPFYKKDEGKYRIIYRLFAIELIHRGLFFKLSEINRSLENNEKVKGNFRSFYCDEFSERYLFYNILNGIYQNRYIEYSGTEIKELHVDAEPDYYIRNGNTIFLFESKDILLNAEIIPSYDFNIYEQEIRKKLYYEEVNGNIENKAVLQLIHNISRILQKQLQFDTNYKTTSVNIYPVLIIHNRQLDVAGLNVIINSWFKTELEKLQERGLNISKIRMITIIDIDSLIFHQDLFMKKILKLENVIDDYFRFTTFDKKKKYGNDEHRIQNVKRTVVPFSIFLSNHVTDKGIRKIPAMLQKKGISLFN